MANNDNGNDNRDRSRYAAMKRSLDLACTLLRSPEDRDGIRIGYSQLLYQREIARNLQIAERYAVSERVAVNAVGFSIRGYHDNHVSEPFDGIFSRSELERFEIDHVHRRNEEQYERGLGFYNESTSKEGVVAQGKTPIKPDEEVHAYTCSLQKGYQHNNGRTGLPNLGSIAEELNSRFHFGKPVRTRGSVRNMLRREKERLNGKS